MNAPHIDAATRAAPDPDAIGVVVVSHWSASTLDDCLTRLRAAAAVSRIVVVDNGSGDDSVARARAQAAGDARIQVLANADNPGFGVACNQGATLLHTPWLALVNPDCLVPPDALARLRGHAQRQADAGLLGCEHVDAAGVADPAVRRRDLTVARMFAGGGRRDSLTIARDDALMLQPVDAVSGALMLMPHALFAHLGGFDPDYRLHAEDLDLCRRVRAAGHRIYVANDVCVLHLRGVSSRRRPLWVEWHKHRGLARYLRKFEVGDAGMARRALAASAIWAHFLLAAPRAWWRARRD